MGVFILEPIEDLRRPGRRLVRYVWIPLSPPIHITSKPSSCEIRWRAIVTARVMTLSAELFAEMVLLAQTSRKPPQLL
jgi:hypothetical protein